MSDPHLRLRMLKEESCTDTDMEPIEENDVEARTVQQIKLLFSTLSQNTQKLMLAELEEMASEKQRQSTIDIVSSLPVHLSIYIFSRLDFESLCCAMQTCRTWRIITQDPILWRRLAHSSSLRLSYQGEVRQLARHRLHALQNPSLSNSKTLMFGASSAHLNTIDISRIRPSMYGSFESVRSLDDSHDAGLGPALDWKAICFERYRLHRNWKLARCNIRTFQGHEQGISCVAYRDSRIASGSSDGVIKVWTTRTNASWSAMTLVGHLEAVRCLEFSSQDTIVSGSNDSTIRVWTLASGPGWTLGSCKLTISAHDGAVRAIRIKDEKIYSASYDTTVKAWDMKTGQCLLTIRAHEDPVLSLALTSDGCFITGSLDKSIKVWSSEGQHISTLTGHGGGVTCLHFDEQRNNIISGSIDGDIRVWDYSNSECLKVIDWVSGEGHKGVVRCLHANDWRIASASDDRTVKVWDLETHQRVTTVRPHEAGVTCIQMDDAVLVSGSFDGTVKLMDFSVV